MEYTWKNREKIIIAAMFRSSAPKCALAWLRWMGITKDFMAPKFVIFSYTLSRKVRGRGRWKTETLTDVRCDQPPPVGTPKNTVPVPSFDVQRVPICYSGSSVLPHFILSTVTWSNFRFLPPTHSFGNGVSAKLSEAP